MAEIRLPVKLEVLQDSIALIKSTLSKLKPESSSWKELSNILQTMTKLANALLTTMSKPFSKMSLFNTAEKGIEKIEDALARARIAMSRVSFSDLNLTQGQEALAQLFIKELKDIESLVKNFKSSLKAELLKGDLWAELLKIDPNIVTKSYDEIVKAVAARVKLIEKESKKAAEALRIATEESMSVETTKKFFEAKKSLSKEGMGEDWNKFFYVDKNDITRFKAGQKGSFYEWMRDTLTITPELYAEIKDKTIKELLEWIKTFDVDKAIKGKIAKKSDAAKEVANIAAEQAKLQELLKTFLNNKVRISNKDEELLPKLDAARAAYNEFLVATANAAREQLNAGVGMGQTAAACDLLRTALQSANAEFMKMDRVSQTFNSIRQGIVNFMGFNLVLNITKRATKEALNHIRELDTVMNKISIVTDMSTGDLWNLVDTYSNMAQKYGVSIKGAYEVSLIYYQQGLETADVMTLTNETLKLAKISGLDYATTTDYMTTAIRGFKMEMSEASRVVDVYSALAANTAVSLQELAVAMTKTASSMQGVGSSFEEASAMIGTMVAVTRESATNIGSAMKSIASRYGELTKDPLKLVDSEGEVMAFNKVDSALQSVGISMKDSNGEFRNFTDVILELSDAWNTLSSTQLRYIATLFAGNRQQSRFLALVSNGDLLRENINVAENSENTGTVLALKALDSIETKTEQLKVAYLEFYTTVGAEDIWKNALGSLTNYVNMLNHLPKLFGKIPVGAIAMITNLVNLVRNAGDLIVSHVAKVWDKALPANKLLKLFSSFMQLATLNVDFNDTSSIDAWIKAMSTKALAMKGTFAEIPEDLIESVVSGLLAGQGIVGDAAETMVSQIIPRLRAALNMHSPSPTIIAMFRNGVGDAIEIGLETSAESIGEAAESLGITVSDELRNAIENSEKIDLTSLFDESTALELFKKVRSIEEHRLWKESSDAHNAAVRGMLDNIPKGEQAILDKREATLVKKHKSVETLGYRLDKIKYEKIPTDLLTGVHNFNPERLLDMAQNFQGRVTSPSTAVKSRYDLPGGAQGFGAGTMYMPIEAIDPSLGLTRDYHGDGYTPTIRDGLVTYDEVRKDLNSLPEIDRGALSFSDYIRDAIHIPDLFKVSELLRIATDLPFNKEGYRESIALHKDLMRAEENTILTAVEYYIRKGGFAPNGKAYGLKSFVPGAQVSGVTALLDALYDTMELMVKLPQESWNLEKLIQENLYSHFASGAKINIPSLAQKPDDSGIVDIIADYMKLLYDNPKYDWVEAKPIGDIPFSRISGLQMPLFSEGGMKEAFAQGMDPRRSFFYDSFTESGPLSYDAIANYILDHVPGAAFYPDRTPVITGEVLDPFTGLIDSIKGFLGEKNGLLANDFVSFLSGDQRGLGTAFLNTVKAGLAGLDFSKDPTGAISEFKELLSRLSSAAYHLFPDYGENSRDYDDSLFGIMLGMSKGALSFYNPETPNSLKMPDSLRRQKPELEMELDDDEFWEKYGDEEDFLVKDVDSVLGETETTETGKNIVAGLTEGMAAETPSATALAAATGGAVIEALLDATGVHSPSILAMFIGENVVKGLSEGILNSLASATAPAEAAGLAILDKLRLGILPTGKEFKELRSLLLGEIKGLESDGAISSELSYALRGVIKDVDKDSFIERSRRASGLIATHNISMDRAQLIATDKLDALLAPSIAVRPLADESRKSAFGGIELLLPQKIADPDEQKHIHAFSGDGYTPMLGSDEFAGDPQGYIEEMRKLADAGFNVWGPNGFWNEINTPQVRKLSAFHIAGMPRLKTAEAFHEAAYRLPSTFSEGLEKEKNLNNLINNFITLFSLVLDPKGGLNLTAASVVKRSLLTTLQEVYNQDENGNVDPEWIKKFFTSLLAGAAALDIGLPWFAEQEQLKIYGNEELINAGLDILYKLKQDLPGGFRFSESKNYNLVPLDEALAMILPKDTPAEIIKHFSKFFKPSQMKFYDPLATEGPQSRVAIEEKLAEKTGATFAALGYNAPEDVKERILDAALAETKAIATEAAPSGLLKWDLDNKNLGPDTTITVPLEPGELPVEEVKEKIELAEGQISMDDILAAADEASNIEKIIAELKELKQLREEINSLENGSVEKTEKLAEFTKKANKFNKELANDKVKQVSWNTGAEKLQERIDAISPKQEESGLLKFDLDKEELSPESTIVVPLESGELPVEEVQSKVDAVTEQVQGLITFDMVLNQSYSDELAEQMEMEAEAYNERFSSGYISTDYKGPEVEPNYDYYEELLRQLEYADFKESSRNTALEDAAAKRAKLLPELDELVDKLVSLGRYTEDVGEVIKNVWKNAAPDELSDKIEKLRGQFVTLNGAATLDFHKVEEADEEALNMPDEELAQGFGESLKKAFDKNTAKGQRLGSIISTIASSMTMVTAMIDQTSETGREATGIITGLSGVMQIVGGFLTGNPWTAALTGVMTIINGISIFIEDDAERMERLTKEAEDAANAMKLAQAEQKSLEKSKKELDDLKEKQYDSEEDMEKYKAAVSEITNQFPELILGFDSANEVILNTSKMEELLAAAREKTALATYDAAQAELKEATEKEQLLKKTLTAKKAGSSEGYGASEVDLAFSALGSLYSEDWDNQPELFKFLADLVTGPVFSSIDFSGSLNNGFTLFDWLHSMPTWQEDFAEKYGFKNEDEYNSFKSDIAKAKDLNGISFDNYESKFIQSVKTLNEVDWNLEKYDSQLQAVDDAAKAMNTALSEYSQGNIDSTKVTEAYNAYSAAIEAVDPLSPISWRLDEARKTAAEIGKNLEENKRLQFVRKLSAEKVTSNYLKLEENEFSKSLLVSNDSALTASLSKILALGYTDKSKDYLNKDFNEVANKIITDTNFMDTFNKAEEFYKALSEASVGENSELIKEFETMLKNPSDYYWTDVLKRFGKINGFNDISSLARGNFDESTDAVRKRLLERRNKIVNKYGSDKSPIGKTFIESKLFTADEQAVYGQYLDKYESLLASKSENEARGYTEMLDVLASIGGIENIDARNNAFALLRKANLNTREGLIAAGELLKQIEDFPKYWADRIIQVGQSLSTNIGLSILSLTDLVNTFWKDLGGQLDKLLNGGIEGYEISGIIEKSPITLTQADFEMTDSGKMRLKYTKWQEYYKAAIASILSQVDDLGTLLTNAIPDDQKLSLEALRQVGISATQEDIDKNESTYREEYNQKIKEFREQYAELYNIPQLMELLLTASQLKSGDFEAILNDLNIANKNNSNAWDRLIKLASNEETFTVKETASPYIKSTVKGIQASMNSLISDVLAKGVDKIDLSDYDYLVKDKIDLTGGLRAIVERYVKTANLTITEANNQIFAAIDKENSKTDINLIKDLSFTGTGFVELTEDLIRNLINTFDVDLTGELGKSLIDTYYNYFDEVTGKAKMSLSSLKMSGIDLSAVDGFESIMNDSLMNLFDTASKNLSDAFNFATEGTTNLADVREFEKAYKEAVNEDLGEDAFGYNSILKTFTLGLDYVLKYIEALRKKMQDLGYSEEFVNKYIEDLTNKALRDSISLDNFLNAKSAKSRNDEANKLILLIRGLSNYKDLFTQDSSLIQKLRDHHFDLESFNQRNWEQYLEQYDQLILETLESGGQAAVDLLKQIKPDASPEELSNVYNIAMTRLNDALSLTEDIMVGSMISTSSELYQILRRVDLTAINADGVITAAYEMTEVYAAIYAEMKTTLGHTNADLNKAYAKLLNALDLQEIDVLEALGNASGMTYEALGDILTKYSNLTLEEFMLRTDNGVFRSGFGKIRVTDWETFAKAAFNVENLDLIKNTPEYLEAYKAYNEGLINYDKEISSNIRDEIKSLANAKRGDKVQLTYLWSLYGEDALDTLLNSYNASIHNGILTLEENANISGIMTKLGLLAAAAGDMIPSELAELEDAIAELLSNIADLISKGFTGELNNVEKLSVDSWAAERGLKDIDWQKTANGWKIVESSIWQCYDAVNALNVAEGEKLRAQIKELKMANSDYYANSQSTAKRIADLKDLIQYEELLQEAWSAKDSNLPMAAFARMNGNLDMQNRKAIENPDGSYSTILGTEFYNELIGEQEVHILMTPIPEWAKSAEDYLSEDLLSEYLTTLIDSEPEIDVQTLLKLDELGLEIDGKHFSNLMADVQDASEVTKEQFHEMTMEVHNASAAWTEMRDKDEAPNNSARIDALEHELALAKEINMERATSKDDSFDFMNNKIPAGQENPLTYAENLTKAFKAINDAYKVNNTYDLNAGGIKRTSTGYMAYQDFYNIVNELNHMAAVSGLAIEIGHTIEGNAYRLDGSLESASNFITEGIKTLTAVDSGEMMVNIGALGINLAKGGENLKNGILDGVDAIADAEIAAIDAMIAVLEVIVAMEKLKEIDADQDMTIDLGEMFEFKVPDDLTSKIIGFTDEYDKIRAWLVDLMGKNKDLAKAMNEFKFGINGKTMSMAEWLNLSFEKLGLDQDGLRAYNKAISAFYTAAMSNDYNLDKVAESVKLVLIDSGVTDLEVDVGDYSLIIKGGNVSVIDWRSEGAEDAIKAYLKLHNLKDNAKNRKTALDAVLEAVRKYTKGGTLSEFELETVLRLNNHYTIDENGEITGVKWNDTTYDLNDPKYRQAIAMNFLKDRGILDPDRLDMDEDLEIVGNTYTYKVTSGRNDVAFVLEFDDNGGIKKGKYIVGGKEYDSLAQAQDKEYEEIIKENMKKTGMTENEAKKAYTKDAYLWEKWKIHAKVETEFTDENGNKFDINGPSGASYRKELLNFQDNVKGITQNEVGNIDIEMQSGVKFTIPGDQVTYEIDENGGKPTLKSIDSINNYISQALLGHDLGLLENITAAITKAFDALPGALEALNGQDTSGLTSIATTIGDIASNASTAATNVGTLVEKLGLLMGGNFKKPTQEVNTPKEAPKTSTGPLGLPPGSKLSASGGTKTDVNFVDNKELVNLTKAAGAEAGTAGGLTAVTAMTEETTKLPGAIDKSGTKEGTATEFESIGDYAADTFLKEFGTLATLLANDISALADQFKEAMKPAADAIASSMNEALAEFENRTVSTLGSVRSHWDTLVKNIIAAVAVIMALVQTMLLKISITWDIKTPLGNLAGEGSGNTEIAEALSAAMSGILDILPALIQLWTEIAKSVTSGPDGIAPKLKIDTTDAETSLRSIKESLTTIQENANIDIAINGELDAIKTGLLTIASLLETISKSSNINITSGKLPEESSTSKSDSEKQVEEEVGVTVKADNVDTSGVEGQTVNLTAKISFEEIPLIETAQTITTEGGVYDIPNFTTIQYIQTVKGKGPGGGCFIAGTQISMADGTTKNIEDIKVGDLVVAYDYKLKKFVPGKVNKAYIHHNTPRLIKITFSNNNYLILTPGHPLLSTKGWKSRDIENSLYEHKTNATWLEIGDEIIGLNNNLIVTDIQEMEVPKNYDTYNAEVEMYHTFIANGLVAHNAKAVVNDTGATGNFGLARAKGTLMGELGPELVVSNGRYFVAGLNGPEMVDLSDDAIVFNHLQTESLLKKGMSNERGRAVTNERNAVAFATGNINGGPAMASASAALAALKQLRAMWESLKSASVSDLAGAGGGGGGGGGGEKEKVIDPKAWVDTVERWFNLMLEIAKLEREITHEETLRSKIQSDWLKDGKAYVKSLRLSLNALKALLETLEQLNLSRREYFNKRIEALEKEPLGKLYTFDADTGKMQFKDSIINGKDGVMEFLTDLVGFDNLKGANHTNKEKYEILMAAGFGDYMKFDDSGNEIKADADNNGETTEEEWESFYENTTKAFWSHIDEFKASTESLWESIAEGENKILELETSMNELWQEIRENQMSLEEEVLKAIEDMKQREIDALSEEREALEASTLEYIQGLSDALNKEREMYETQEQEDELNRKRRRLGILERSGASAADITSLQLEIDDLERDLYFDIQQLQIDAIQEASDKEIERLDNQIDIMTLQLEFQKEFGLLWNDVYQVMNSSAQLIVSFIMNGNSEFWASSPLSTADGFHNLLFLAEAWKEYSDNMDTITNFANFLMKEKMALAYNTYDTAMKNEFGGSYDLGNRYMKAGGYKEIFDSVYSETGDLTKATETVRKTYSNHKKYLDREALANSFGVPWKKDNGDTEYRAIDDNEHWAFRYARENINGVEAYYFQSASRENHSWNNGECSKCHHKLPAPPMPAGGGFGGGGSGDSSKNIAYYERNGTKYRHVLMDGTKGPWIEEAKAGLNAINFVKRKEENLKKQLESKYVTLVAGKKNKASGGYVGHGIYELGERGTETVLTAEQTQVLRNNILSNRPNSLISLLKSYNQGYSQISKPLTGIATTEDNSTTIEKVELNMNVLKIANDYDAKRAGEQALSEMLRIAKKTSAANSVRR